MADVTQTADSKCADFLREIMDANPSFMLVVDDDVRVLEYNRAAAALLGEDKTKVIKHRGGDVLHCIHRLDVPEGCGRGPVCKTCIIRNSVNAAIKGRTVIRQRAKLDLEAGGRTVEFHALATASPFTWNGGNFVLLVVEDINEIMELRKLVPICASCKKIRDEKEYWVAVEAYLHRHLDLKFSHGLCPDCASAIEAQLEKAE